MLYKESRDAFSDKIRKERGNIQEVIWFDKYLVLSEIGRGSGSTVYLVRHQKLGEYRAVKRILKDSDFTWQIRESDILNHLKHPKIPQIYDMEEDEEAYYIVEEYIEGESLEALMLQSSFITLNFVYHTIMEVADVLDYMHHLKPKPMIYQDLKAEHVIIGKDGVRLIDFGIASYLEETGNKFQNYGTLEFCAPEKCNDAVISVQTDIYSLGKLLEALISANGEKESQCLMHIAKKASNLDLTERYDTVEAFQTDLKEHMQSMKKSIYQKHLLRKIVVAGSQPHIGTTHISISLTDYLNQQKPQSVYQEKNPSENLRKAIQQGGFTKEGGLYRKRNFLGMPKYGEGVEVKAPQNAVAVYDYGTDIAGAISEEADLFLLVVGSREWEIEYADLAYKKVKGKQEVIVIVNYGSGQTAKYYAKAYGQTVYCFPLDANPFFMTREKEKLFEGLLEKEGGESEKKEHTKCWNCWKHPRQWGNTFGRGIGKLCSKWTG